jgi:hypothetical protein
MEVAEHVVDELAWVGVALAFGGEVPGGGEVGRAVGEG